MLVCGDGAVWGYCFKIGKIRFEMGILLKCIKLRRIWNVVNDLFNKF